MSDDKFDRNFALIKSAFEAAGPVHGYELTDDAVTFLCNRTLANIGKNVEKPELVYYEVMENFGNLDRFFERTRQILPEVTVLNQKLALQVVQTGRVKCFYPFCTSVRPK